MWRFQFYEEIDCLQSQFEIFLNTIKIGDLTIGSFKNILTLQQHQWLLPLTVY